MFQIFFLFIYTSCACKSMFKNLSIYTVLGERYVMPLSKIFEEYNQNYSCINCSENITLWNTYNRLSQNDIEYTTKSLASNGTHFVILTLEKTINLYIYENEIMSLTCLINIDPNLQCFNSLFTYSNSIIIDCYDNNDNTLQFYCLKICELSLYQTIQNQTIPSITKMKRFLSGQRTYLLYDQSYSNYHLLTLFQNTDNQLINRTTWTQYIWDFDVSNQFIYIISKQLVQLFVTDDNTFSVSFNYSINEAYPFYGFKVQNPILYYSNYDIIYALYSLTSQYITILFAAQNGSILQIGITSFIMETKSQFTQISISDYFVLYQVGNDFQIFEIYPFNLEKLYMYNHSNSETQQYSYFDSLQNRLFQFSNQIVISQIKIPQIEIYFNHEKQLDPFIIQSYSPYIKQFNQTCYSMIQPFILQKSDKTIYQANVLKQQMYFIYQNNSFCYYISGFTGPLQRTSFQMLNQELGQFQDITFRPLNLSFPQQFQVTNFQNLDKNRTDVFLVGTSNGDIFFYSCLNLTQCTLIYSDVQLLTITQISIIFSSQSSLLVGINQGINDIRIYKFNVQTNAPQSIIEFSGIYVYSVPAYKQFLFTYDNVIVLLESQNIIIQSLTSSDQFTLGDKEISQLFPNYDIKSINFKPIQMAMNVIDLSSILYINNQNSVIIVVVQSTYEIIPYAILNVDYQIYQINIIVQKLILSYKCETNICFEEWNVLNLNQPQFIKILPSVQMQRGWQIVSDNLFLYVKSQYNTMYVFNPALSYHNSLYYEFNFTGDYFSSIAIEYQTMFLLGNQFFRLYAQMYSCFQATTSNTEQQYIQQTLFNIQVSNKFSIATTPNKLLSVINPVTKIQLLENQNFTSKIHVPYIINLDPVSYVQQSGSIIASYMTQNEKKQYCYLKNYIEFQNKVENQPSCQPLWIFTVNNILIMQCFYNMSNYFYANQISHNQRTWTVIYVGQENYTNCSMPFVYNQSKIIKISQLCSFNNSWYLTIFLFENYYLNVNFTKKIMIAEPIYNITNLISINNNSIFFFQAVQQGAQYEVVYVTNINVNSTFQKFSCYIIDGLFSYSVIEFKYKPNYYLIMNICQQEIFYQTGFVNSKQDFQMITFQSKLFLLNDHFIIGNVKLAQTLILSQQKNQMIFLLNTNLGPCFIIQASFYFVVRQKYNYFHMFFGQIIQTIPPYGNYQLTQSTPILNGLMFFTYISNNDKVYAIYDLTSVHKNITNPLLIKGGYNSSLPLPTNIAFNFISIQEGGQFYELINNTINNYTVVGNAYLNCTIDQKKDYSVKLIAYNSFSNDTLTITYYYVTVYQWYVGLLIFLAVFFTIASFVFWYNTRDLKTEDNFLAEVELELNE